MAETTDFAELSLEQILAQDVEIESKVLKATRGLAKSKPWRGEPAKRLADLVLWAECVAGAWGLGVVKLQRAGASGGTSAASGVSPDGRKITLRGRLSVVTTMHLLAKSRQIIQSGLGLNLEAHRQAIVWSVNLFKKCFPLSFSRCRLENGLLVNDSRRD
jgi:hypothetical protein